MLSEALNFIKYIMEWALSLIQSCLCCLGSKSIHFESSNRTVRLEKSIIGEGGFSQVLMGLDTTNSKSKYAVKKILIQSEEDEKSASLEITYLKSFVHENIVPFLGAAYETQGGHRVAYLLFPLIKNGNLRQRMNAVLENKHPPFSLHMLLWSFTAITSAVESMHSRNPAYVHRDIKPDNILLDEDDKPLLTDFGSVGLGNIPINSRSDALLASEDAARLCTLPYRAPELFDPVIGSVIDVRTDVWALGCLFYSYCFGYSPFECTFGQAGNVPHVVECSYLRILGKIPRPSPAHISQREAIVLDLVSWMLNQMPAHRPFCADVLSRLALIGDTCGDAHQSSSGPGGDSMAIISTSLSSTPSIVRDATASFGDSGINKHKFV